MSGARRATAECGHTVLGRKGSSGVLFDVDWGFSRRLWVYAAFPSGQYSAGLWDVVSGYSDGPLCVLRYKAEEQRFDLKHKRKLEELKAKADATIKELEQLHNEKREFGRETGFDVPWRSGIACPLPI